MLVFNISLFTARSKFWDMRASRDEHERSNNESDQEIDDGKFAGFWYVNFQSLSELNEHHVAQGQLSASKRRRQSV